MKQNKKGHAMGPKALSIVVLVATLTFVLSPLASTEFNGFSYDQFPVLQIDPPVQPAGYAFSIWGVIYLWLVVSAVFGLLRAANDPDWDTMRPALAISLITGTFWIAAANVAPVLATGMIVVMAAAAITAMLRAGSGKPWLLARPIALYAGWLTAATGVAIGVVVDGYGIMPVQTAAILCLIGVLIVALTVQAARPREWAYPVAVIWALIGVAVANLTSPNWPVIALCVFGITVLIVRAVQSAKKGTNP
jgi:hypothetical protein